MPECPGKPLAPANPSANFTNKAVDPTLFKISTKPSYTLSAKSTWALCKINFVEACDEYVSEYYRAAFIHVNISTSANLEISQVEVRI